MKINKKKIEFNKSESELEFRNSKINRFLNDLIKRLLDLVRVVS